MNPAANAARCLLAELWVASCHLDGWERLDERLSGQSRCARSLPSWTAHRRPAEGLAAVWSGCRGL